MYYKLMNNDIVVDLLREICYVRYMPKSERWICTDGMSAHGVLGSDKDTVYHLEGRTCPCKTSLPRVMIVEISEQEYFKIANEIALRKKENEELTKRIDSLEKTLIEQNQLIQQLIQKISM